MKLRLLTIALAGMLLLGASAYADSFTGPTGPLGSSSVFTIDGTTVTAYAFTSPGTAGNLYFKNSGITETGIGLTTGLAHEIGGSSFVTLDISNLLSLDATSLALSMESVEHGESYEIWGSNSLGTPGTVLVGKQTMGGVETNVPGFGSYKYISVSAPTGQVLINDLVFTSTSTVPEPSTVGLLLAGLALLAGMVAMSNKANVLRAN